MKKNEVARIISNFTQQTKSQAILFYAQASYSMNNIKTFRELMFFFLRNSYCENKNGNENCDCKNCSLIKNLNHPDIKIVTPMASGDEIPKFFIDFFLDQNSSQENFSEKKLAINKEQITDVQNFINYSSPSFGKNKTVIFWLPEYMNHVAMNLLLKTVEEPPEYTNFLFFSEQKELLLPTLLSRMVQFFVPGEEEQVENFEENMQLFIEWMRMCYAKKYVKIVPFIEDFAKREKEFQKDFFIFLGFIFEQLWFASLGLYMLLKLVDKNFETINKMANMFSPESIQKIYGEVNQGFKNLKRNANVKLILMNLSLEIIKNKK
ncbi:MAG: hypothetical protein LBD32_02685 [Cytophagales bacterium]|jgi:DNA polymerase-3 subunit delta'|nr:hypothetical protein [Cytophagales bacterium]